jgi:hypothetical protein
MEVHIYKSSGLRNDLLLIIPRSEIAETLFHIADHNELRRLPGLLRHVPNQDADERRRVNVCKVPVEEHLRRLSARGLALVDDRDRPQRRLIVIGSRNVGNNHGFVAWQRDEQHRLFHVKGDPLNYSSYSCLVRHWDGRLAVRALRFEQERVLEGDVDITEEVVWCVYANWVLRDGKVVSIEDVIDQFYDIRHVLAFDRGHPVGQHIEAEIYEGYPERFRDNALRVWQEKGVPRNRFLHNCLGLSEDNVFILQREGTIEEVAHCLKEVGAKDGLVLDNGGSVFCWAWWLYPQGGFLFTAPDFRPNSSAVIALVLKGPVGADLPSGSVSFSVV